MKKPDWELIDPLFGTTTDSEISKIFGLKYTQVRRRRLALGIPRCRRPTAQDKDQNYSWPNEKYNWASVRDRLGIDSDPIIAKELGCTRAAVQLYRKKHGNIPAKNQQYTSKSFDWAQVDWRYGNKYLYEKHKTQGIGSIKHITDMRRKVGFRSSIQIRKPKVYNYDYTGLVSELGKVSDRSLAKKYGLWQSQANRLRTRLGIPSHTPKIRVDFTKFESVLRDTSLTASAVARLISHSINTVLRWRKKLGISWNGRVRYDWKAVAPYWGKLLDSEIAKKFRMSPDVVTHYRIRHNIPKKER